MYPKGVVEALLQGHPNWLVAAEDSSGDIFRSRVETQAASGFTIEDWILERASSDEAIGKYLHFLRAAKAKFSLIADSMGYWNAEASHLLKHDQWSVGWAGDALLPIANYLYVLRSLGVAGDCLECGAFKGSSTACLSFVCRELQLTLYCADSFAGLPSSEGHYRARDFFGSRAEVEDNVRKCGSIESVKFVEGWYQSSLRGFAQPLSVIWMDVDLQQSVVDVMENVFGYLDPHGVIFSDGFSVGVDFTPDNKLMDTGGEPAGFYRFFRNRGMEALAIPAGPKGLALILPRPERTSWLKIHSDRFQYLIDNI